MDLQYPLTPVPRGIDHSCDESMISESVLTRSRITRGLDIRKSIDPEKSYLRTFRIIRALGSKVQ